MEVVVAVFVLVVGVMGVYSLIQQAIAFTTVSSSRLIAIYLAQEGMEIARNIRDNNLLEIHKGLKTEDQWTDGLTGCEGGCQADYTYDVITGYPYVVGDTLQINPSKLYNYQSGEQTPFERKIRIFDIEDIDGLGVTDRMKVSVEVIWKERGRSHKVAVEEHLYRWLK